MLKGLNSFTDFWCPGSDGHGIEMIWGWTLDVAFIVPSFNSIEGWTFQVQHFSWKSNFATSFVLFATLDVLGSYRYPVLIPMMQIIQRIWNIFFLLSGNVEGSFNVTNSFVSFATFMPGQTREYIEFWKFEKNTTDPGIWQQQNKKISQRWTCKIQPFRLNYRMS